MCSRSRRQKFEASAYCKYRRVAPRGAWRVHGRQEGLRSLARFLLGRKPRLRRPASRADGLASDSPKRLIGCALLAVNAPPSGLPTLRCRNRAPSARIFGSRGSAPAPPAQPELPASQGGCGATSLELRSAAGSSSGERRRSISLAGMR